MPLVLFSHFLIPIAGQLVYVGFLGVCFQQVSNKWLVMGKICSLQHKLPLLILLQV